MQCGRDSPKQGSSQLDDHKPVNQPRQVVRYRLHNRSCLSLLHAIVTCSICLRAPPCSWFNVGCEYTNCVHDLYVNLKGSLPLIIYAGHQRLLLACHDMYANLKEALDHICRASITSGLVSMWKYTARPKCVDMAGHSVISPHLQG